MIWSDLRSILHGNQSFLITSHMSPDGDCIGSQLAMYWYLGELGKDVCIYNSEPVPSKFAFLHNAGAIGNQKPTRTFDVLVVLDCSNPHRLGWDGYESMACTVVNIDHHRDNALFGDCNLVDSGAATGEHIFRFFKHFDIEYPPHVAEALYAAILTDTGGFRFSNTNAEILRICAELVDKGARCADIYETVYASMSHPAMVLHSRIWSTVAFHLDGRVCTMDLPLALVPQLGAAYSDSEGMADLTITVGEVDVGMFIKHTDKQTHFSLRSKGRLDVGRIARRIRGGGGHSNAAGCTIEESRHGALPKMLAIIQEELAAL